MTFYTVVYINDSQLEMDTGTLSIADSVKQAAEAVVQKQQADMLHDSGYIYDEHSGLYYHPASGYYYDQVSSKSNYVRYKKQPYVSLVET